MRMNEDEHGLRSIKEHGEWGCGWWDGEVGEDGVGGHLPQLHVLGH